MKKLTALLCLLLAICLLLQGCRLPRFIKDPTKAPTTEAPTEPPATEPTEPQPVKPDETPSASVSQGEDAMIRWKNGGYRDYLPDEPVDLKKFTEMVYERPDVEAMYAAFDELIALAADSRDANALLERYYDVYNDYIRFYSMDTLANIHYSIDQTDEFYRAEYDYCEAEPPNVEEKLERLNKAFAAGPTRERLEALYFGEGYFLQFDDYEVYTNEEYLALSKQEKEILTRYRDLTTDQTVEYKGEERSFEELLETTTGFDYLGVLRSYYDKYNPEIGEVFIELIKIRQQLAAVLGYESYAAYAYDITYSRDYTPEQGEDFIEAIENYLVPIYEDMQDSRAYRQYQSGDIRDAASEAQVRAMVKSASEEIGGAVKDAYLFLERYELCDLKKADKKMNGSFMTYIFEYESPFVMVNSTGTARDFTTFSHEFGHFTDAFYNYDASEDLETAETFSQAMEFLALVYSKEINDKTRENLLYANTVDTLETFISQAAFAKFESQVYALPEDQLTVEKINQIYLQVTKDFDFYERGFDFYYSQSWIDVLHFFEAPCYVISYCVSADTALQVYEIETENPGKGVETYFKLLERTYDAGVQQICEESGLRSPFDVKSMQKIADFFVWALGLEE